MLKRLLVASVVLLGSLWPVGPALAAGLNDVVSALEGPFRADAPAAAAIRDFEGDFFQESRIASLDKVQRGRGRVAIRFDRRDRNRPPLVMFRWEYDQPNNQEIVSDGHTMWVYLPENNQVVQSDIDIVNRTTANDPLTFLTGLGNLSRDFTIGWAEPNRDADGNWVLSMTPRRPSPLIAKLLIVVDRRAVDAWSRSGNVDDYLPLLSSTVYDPGGNSTLIEFSDMRPNRGLPASYFSFMIPAGVEVVRPTGQGMGY